MYPIFPFLLLLAVIFAPVLGMKRVRPHDDNVDGDDDPQKKARVDLTGTDAQLSLAHVPEYVEGQLPLEDLPSDMLTTIFRHMGSDHVKFRPLNRVTKFINGFLHSELLQKGENNFLKTIKMISNQLKRLQDAEDDYNVDQEEESRADQRVLCIVNLYEIYLGAPSHFFYVKPAILAVEVFSHDVLQVPGSPDEWYLPYGNEYARMVVKMARRNTLLKWVKLEQSHGIYLDRAKIFQFCTIYGNLEFLKIIYEGSEVPLSIADFSNGLEHAASLDHIDIIKYLLQDFVYPNELLEARPEADNDDEEVILTDEKREDQFQLLLGIALGEAVKGGNLEIVKYLINVQKADVEMVNEYDISVAVNNCNLELLELVIHTDLNMNSTDMEVAFKRAIKHKKVDIVKLFVQRGFPYTREHNGIRHAAKTLSVDCLWYLYSLYSPEHLTIHSIILEAVCRVSHDARSSELQIDIAQQMLDMEADPSYLSYSCLYSAIRIQSSDLILMLIGLVKEDDWQDLRVELADHVLKCRRDAALTYHASTRHIRIQPDTVYDFCLDYTDIALLLAANGVDLQVLLNKLTLHGDFLLLDLLLKEFTPGAEFHPNWLDLGDIVEKGLCYKFHTKVFETWLGYLDNFPVKTICHILETLAQNRDEDQLRKFLFWLKQTGYLPLNPTCHTYTAIQDEVEISLLKESLITSFQRIMKKKPLHSAKLLEDYLTFGGGITLLDADYEIIDLFILNSYTVLVNIYLKFVNDRKEYLLFAVDEKKPKVVTAILYEYPEDFESADIWTDLLSRAARSSTSCLEQVLLFISNQYVTDDQQKSLVNSIIDLLRYNGSTSSSLNRDILQVALGWALGRLSKHDLGTNIRSLKGGKALITAYFRPNPNEGADDNMGSDFVDGGNQLVDKTEPGELNPVPYDLRIEAGFQQFVEEEYESMLEANIITENNNRWNFELGNYGRIPEVVNDTDVAYNLDVGPNFQGIELQRPEMPIFGNNDEVRQDGIQLDDILNNPLADPVLPDRMLPYRDEQPDIIDRFF